ncbi:unnamed protein product [Mytilus coruscus]|uniref:Endonuclease/exonuclease/phosphatase domain-containing protein n=1 Tax=Mytilus coruscus TaxID=42192 RepID=A0A6J8A817_MYTCO|nr:unnamed protein product [Mytilus coruscus]
MYPSNQKLYYRDSSYNQNYGEPPATNQYSMYGAQFSEPNQYWYRSENEDRKYRNHDQKEISSQYSYQTELETRNICKDNLIEVVPNWTNKEKVQNHISVQNNTTYHLRTHDQNTYHSRHTDQQTIDNQYRKKDNHFTTNLQVIQIIFIPSKPQPDTALDDNPCTYVNSNCTNNVLDFNDCEQKNMKVLSFNCKNILTCGPFFREMKEDVDIYLLQEHWLFDCQLNMLNEIHSKYIGIEKSVDTDDPLPQIQMPRGYGGVAILWRKELDPFISTLKAGNSRIQCIEIEGDPNIIIVSLYLPCKGPTNSTQELLECIDQLNEINKYSENIIDIQKLNVTSNVSDHYPLLLSVLHHQKKLNITKNSQTSEKTFNKRIKRDKIDTGKYASLISTEISSTKCKIQNREDLESGFNTLNNIIIKATKDIAPNSKKGKKKPKLQVMNEEIRKAISNKKIAFYNWKSNGSINDPHNYYLKQKKLTTYQLRKQCRLEIAIRRINERQKLIDSKVTDTKTFFRMIRNQRAKMSKHIDELNVDNQIYHSDNQIINGWHIHFGELAKKLYLIFVKIDIFICK